MSYFRPLPLPLVAAGKQAVGTKVRLTTAQGHVKRSPGHVERSETSLHCPPPVAHRFPPQGRQPRTPNVTDTGYWILGTRYWLLKRKGHPCAGWPCSGGSAQI